jgi:hypothetical protein
VSDVLVTSDLWHSLPREVRQAIRDRLLQELYPVYPAVRLVVRPLSMGELMSP